MKSKEVRLMETLFNAHAVLTKVGSTYIVSGTKFDTVAKILLSETMMPLSVKETYQFASYIPPNISKYTKSFFEQHTSDSTYFRTFAASIQGPDGSIKLIHNIFDYFSPAEILEEKDMCRRGVELSKGEFERVQSENSLYLNFDEVKLLARNNNQELVKRITDFFDVEYNPATRFKVDLNPYKKSFDRYEAPQIEVPGFTYLHIIGVQREQITADTSFCDDNKPVLFRID